MYLALFLTDDHTLGSAAMRMTPDNTTKPGVQSDSLVNVNNVSDPEIFVIFKTNQAYPSYLITFELIIYNIVLTRQ